MTLTVVAAGPLTTVQDRGRVGLAHLGVPRAGPLDAPAAGLANRLVGNVPDAAVLEVTMGGFAATSDVGVWVAVTGAGVAHPAATWVEAAGRVEIGTPGVGARSYLAVAGGIDVEPVLGSRSTDTLAWVGPPRVEVGAELPVGPHTSPPAPFDAPRPPRPGPVRVVAGPRADWFAADALDLLCATPYVVAGSSNRVGLRLEGRPLTRVRDDELASEGMVLGAVQVPPDGRPMVLLADHPPTGGYPVLAVVHPDDLWRCGQARPGDGLRFVRGV